MSDFLIGFVRTYVPITVGAFISWLVTLGITLSPETKTGAVTFLTGLFIAVYYTAVRLLAEKWPSIGILLGYNKAPSYNE